MKFHEYVLPGRTIDRSRVISHKIIHNDRTLDLERFSLEINGECKSFIFKPVVHTEIITAEQWVQTNIPSLLPMAKVPHVYDFGPDWIIYEDIGNLRHDFSESSRVRAATFLPHLHCVPLEVAPVTYSIQTPYLETILADLQSNLGFLADIMQRYGIPINASELNQRILDTNPFDQDEPVICHGDFHCMNFVVSGNQLTVLDWEFVQPNSVYRDLYTLIDLTSPRFRVQTNSQLRMEVLSAYLAEQRRITPARSLNADQFIDNYHRYALFYSIWELLWVREDEGTGIISRDQADLVNRETCDIIADCLDYLSIAPEIHVYA